MFLSVGKHYTTVDRLCASSGAIVGHNILRVCIRQYFIKEYKYLGLFASCIYLCLCQLKNQQYEMLFLATFNTFTLHIFGLSQHKHMPTLRFIMPCSDCCQSLSTNGIVVGTNQSRRDLRISGSFLLSCLSYYIMLTQRLTYN